MLPSFRLQPLCASPTYVFSGRIALLDAATASAGRSLTTVCAPWGYGKTTLLKAWQQHGPAGGDGALYVDLSGLTAMTGERSDCAERLLAHVHHLQGPVTLPPLAATVDEMAAQLAHGLEQLSVEALILDHYPAQDPLLDALTGRLVQDGQGRLHVVLGAQRPLSSPWRGKLDGTTMATIGLSDLTLTRDEVALYCERQGVDPQQVFRLSEGWPWAVDMVCRLIRGRPANRDDADEDDKALLSHLTAVDGTYAADMIHHLFSGVPEADLDVLTRTSFLDLLDPDLVAAVVGDREAWRSVDRLRMLGLLQPSLSDGREAGLRCHRLVRAALFERLKLRGERPLQRLHTSAALHFMRKGLLKPALRHACEGRNSALAVGLFLKAGGVAICVREGLSGMRACLDMLPRDALAQPRVRVAVAALMLVDGRTQICQDILDDVKKHDDVVGSDPDTLLVRDIRLVEVFGQTLGVPSASQIEHDYAAFVTPSPVAEHAVMQGVIYNLKCIEAHRMGQLKHALVCADTASYFYRAAQVDNGFTQIGFRHARILRARGDLAGASDKLETLRQLLIEREDPDLADLAHVDVQWAAIQAERGDFLAAEPLCRAVLSRLKSGERQWEALLDGFLALSGARSFAMKPDEALHELHAGLMFARAEGMVELEAMLRLRLLQEDIFAGLVDVGKATAECEAIAQVEHWQVLHARCLVNANLLAMSGRCREGLALLEEAEGGLEAAGIARALLECRLDRAVILERQGLRDEAVRVLQHALSLAESGAIILPFVERRDALHAVLIQCQLERLVPAQRSSEVTFGSDVLARLFAQDESHKAQLSPKEREIMRDLAAGYSNKEIARNFNVSPETIRFHLKNVYTKLGVNAGRGNRQIVADFARQNLLAR